MKITDFIKGTQFEGLSFSEISGHLAKAKNGAQEVTEQAKEFFKEHISEDFWRNKHEKEASI